MVVRVLGERYVPRSQEMAAADVQNVLAREPAVTQSDAPGTVHPDQVLVELAKLMIEPVLSHLFGNCPI